MQWVRSGALVGALIMGGGTMAQEAAPFGAPAATMPSPEQMAEQMERWKATMVTDQHHEVLGQLVGNWETTTRVLMGGPTPQESSGKMSARWLIEGRWLLIEGSGTMMGMPNATAQIWGYDQFKQKYVSTMVSSLGTNLLTCEGNFDQSGKALHCYGTMDEPMTGEHDKMVRYTLRFKSPDEYVFEVHDLAIGEVNTLVVEYRSKRVKP